MRKQALILTGALILLFNQAPFALAKTQKMPADVKLAVKKYKAGNYTGCLQDLQHIVQKRPSSLAYYYIAMSYTQAGKSAEAIKSYSKCLSMSPTQTLSEYATMGKPCLETPDMCHPQTTDNESDLDQFIKANTSNFSEKVKQDYQQKQLNNVKNQMNNGKELDDYNFKDFRDFSKQKSNKNTDNKIAQVYSEKDIQKAIKVLNEAGINPADVLRATAKTTAVPTETKATDFQDYASNTQAGKDLAQLRTLFGENNNNNNDNNSFENMLPLLMKQSQDGKNNCSPEMLQTMMMRSMMTDFSYDK